MGNFRFALSVSPFTEQLLSDGVVFAEGGATATTVRDVQRLFRGCGGTEVYARIATTNVTHAVSGGAEHGLLRGLERARLARELNMPFNPELGLFRSYGDVLAYQEPPDFSDCPDVTLPAPWFELSIDQMADAVRVYTASTARRILDTGAEVNLWNLGNEVEAGLAGITMPAEDDTGYTPPDAVDPEIARMDRRQLMLATSESDRIDWLSRHVWPYVGRLLAAAAAGVREADPEARFSTHVAGANPSSPRTWTSFWEVVADEGYLPDVFGTSMYPSGPKQNHPDNLAELLRDAALQLAERWNRPTFIAEWAYPTADVVGPFQFGRSVPGYPRGEQGQHDYLCDLITRGRREGWLDGIRPWAPDLAAGHWAPLSLFELEGNVARARRALHVLGSDDESEPR